MKQSSDKFMEGYRLFRKLYAEGNNSIMENLAYHGQEPDVMVIACCDSRVDPALIMQCDPGDLFVVRNVANIVPSYEKDAGHHGVSAALEFGICYLKVKHLILLGHSRCGGIQALLDSASLTQNDFISHWVNLVDSPQKNLYSADDYAKIALVKSFENCMTFPWIKEKVANEQLMIHLWFFDIKNGQIQRYSEKEANYLPLE